MKKPKKQAQEKSKPSQAPLKPKQPLTEGAPNDQDRNAQYEDKDES